MWMTTRRSPSWPCIRSSCSAPLSSGAIAPCSAVRWSECWSCSTDVPGAVIDIGTNTTGLLVADREDGDVVELERRTTITSLGKGVDATGRLSDEAMDRVAEAIAAYREIIDRLGA